MVKATHLQLHDSSLQLLIQGPHPPLPFRILLLQFSLAAADALLLLIYHLRVTATVFR